MSIWGVRRVTLCVGYATYNRVTSIVTPEIKNASAIVHHSVA